MSSLVFQGVLGIQQYIISGSIRLALSALFAEQLAELVLPI